MKTNYICHAHGDKARAAVALAFPIGAIALAAWFLMRKGYGPFDYFHLVFSRELSLFRQMVGWIALAFWAARFWPSAWSVFEGESCLIRTDDDRLILGGRSVGSLRDIDDFKLKNGVFSKKVVFLKSDKIIYAQSIMFSREKFQKTSESITRAIRDSKFREASLVEGEAATG